MKICNLTSVHPRYDVRIFHKQCWAQSLQGKAHLVVSDNGKDEIKDNIHIHSVKGYRNRFLRITLAVWNVYRTAKSIKADVYVLHDPELLSIALLLKRTGAKVFFDSHECYTESIQECSNWIPSCLKKFVIRTYQTIEAFVLKRLDGVIAANDHIGEILSKCNKNIFVLHNYALLKEFSECEKPNIDISNHVLYCGGISGNRGILQMIKALELCHNDVKLILCGTFLPSILLDQCKSLPGWSNVDYMGQIDRQKLHSLAAKCFCGLVLFNYENNNKNGIPNKIFEYAGMYLPVIASDFDLWKKIVGNDNKPLGSFVDPETPQEIANAIDKLYENKALAKHLGGNGRKAVETKYNFESEMEEFLKLLKK